jgi:hypothetical protein
LDGRVRHAHGEECGDGRAGLSHSTITGLEPVIQFFAIRARGGHRQCRHNGGVASGDNGADFGAARGERLAVAAMLEAIAVSGGRAAWMTCPLAQLNL